MGLGLPSPVPFGRLHHIASNISECLGKLFSKLIPNTIIFSSLFSSQFQNFSSLIMSVTDQLGNICLVYKHTEYFCVSVDDWLFAMDLDEEHWLK